MKKNDDLHQYKMFGLPLLRLMAILAIIGIVVTIALHYLL